MHRKRASGSFDVEVPNVIVSLGVEVPNVMEKGRWMFSPRNHATMKNHISLSINLY
jgi:hypothetical protein